MPPRNLHAETTDTAEKKPEPHINKQFHIPRIIEERDFLPPAIIIETDSMESILSSS